MTLRAPDFWSMPPGESAAARLLRPLGALYHAEVQRRLGSAQPYRAPVPVICVGNATLGGVGKTPLVRWIAERLVEQGREVRVLTRGYGGKLKGPVRVTPRHGAAEVGDEPLMLAKTLPVWVSRDRAAGAKAAAADGADVIVMDDGLQNPSIVKDRSLLVVDGVSLFGNGEVFPAGPLRERPEAAADRSSALVAMLRGPDGRAPASLRTLAGGKPLIEAWFSLDHQAIPDAPLVAFCGIGRPERFFASLLRAEADLIKPISFADHHPYTAQDLEGLRETAQKVGARLVTTEKDHGRLAPDDRKDITPIGGRLTVRDPSLLDALWEIEA